MGHMAGNALARGGRRVLRQPGKRFVAGAAQLFRGSCKEPRLRGRVGGVTDRAHAAGDRHMDASVDVLGKRCPVVAPETEIRRREEETGRTRGVLRMHLRVTGITADRVGDLAHTGFRVTVRTLPECFGGFPRTGRLRDDAHGNKDQEQGVRISFVNIKHGKADLVRKINSPPL